MSVIYKICLVLLIVGGLNWGLVGLFDFNLVGWLFGGSLSWLARAVFILVGLAAIALIPTLFMSKPSEHREPNAP